MTLVISRITHFWQDNKSVLRSLLCLTPRPLSHRQQLCTIYRTEKSPVPTGNKITISRSFSPYPVAMPTEPFWHLLRLASGVRKLTGVSDIPRSLIVLTELFLHPFAYTQHVMKTRVSHNDGVYVIRRNWSDRVIIYIYIYVCVCVCVWERERTRQTADRERERETWKGKSRVKYTSKQNKYKSSLYTTLFLINHQQHV
jgi:hypothetical protein